MGLQFFTFTQTGVSIADKVPNTPTLIPPTKTRGSDVNNRGSTRVLTGYNRSGRGRKLPIPGVVYNVYFRNFGRRSEAARWYDTYGEVVMYRMFCVLLR